MIDGAETSKVRLLTYLILLVVDRSINVDRFSLRHVVDSRYADEQNFNNKYGEVQLY